MQEKPILRDYLATDRTILANERTLLAYGRTALTLFVVGATFIKFFGDPILELIGWIFIPVGIIVMIAGISRFKKTKLLIQDIEKRNGFQLPGG